jgi:hypothetical protein
VLLRRTPFPVLLGIFCLTRVEVFRQVVVAMCVVLLAVRYKEIKLDLVGLLSQIVSSGPGRPCEPQHRLEPGTRQALK